MSETTTVYVSIGNSDDRLSQGEWSDFTCRVDGILRAYAHVHGAWYSLPDARFQNACWCAEFTGPHAVRTVRASLAEMCGRYRQDSIAWAVAETEFLGVARDLLENGDHDNLNSDLDPTGEGQPT